jgi:hypothetical protein
LNQALRYRNLTGFLKGKTAALRHRSSSAQIQRPPRLTWKPDRREGFEDIFSGEKAFQQSG